jgi:hypothetical protein
VFAVFVLAAGLFVALTVGLVSPAFGASPALLTTTFTPSHAAATTQDKFSGVEITYTNTLSSSQVALIYASLVNQAGETVGVSLFSQTLAASSQATFFFAFPQAPGGSYTVVILATAPGYVPISTPTSVPLTL